MDRIYHLKDTGHIDLHINKEADIIIYLDGDGDVDYKVHDAKANILYIVDDAEELQFKERGYLYNSEVNVFYFDLTDTKTKVDTVIEVYRDCKLSTYNKYLAKKDKDITITCVNTERDSEVNIDNSAVVFDDAHINLVCSGKILKGAKAAISHQKSRSLVYGKPRHVDIRPVLLIEESDVEASHALSSGTIDDDVLYYMNSRGIDNSVALKLVIDSYLLCDDKLLTCYENSDELIRELKERMERNVR